MKNKKHRQNIRKPVKVHKRNFKAIKVKNEKKTNKTKNIIKEIKDIHNNIFNIGDSERNKFLFYIPRILTIIFILCIIIFAADIFGKNYSFGQTIISAIILIVILVISWKYELVGGIGYILFGLWYITAIRGFSFSEYLAVAGPAFIIGAMFLCDWFMKNRQR